MEPKYFIEKFKQNTDPFVQIVGQEKVKHDVKSALLTGRHLIIIGPPGIGKTTLAKSIVEMLPEVDPNQPIDERFPQIKTEKFVRVQGSPDLTVEDLIGDIDPVKALEYGPLSMQAFTPGKIFKANGGVLFFDEVNRAPPKIQNALLQVLEERRATVGSYSIDFPANFVLVATMNPEDASTEKLSDVFLDRFDITYMQYPETQEREEKIVADKGKKLGVQYPTQVLMATVGFVRNLRKNDDLKTVPSVRATLGLYERAQANALLRNATEVIWKDVEDAMLSVLSHRVELKPSLRYVKQPMDFLREKIAEYKEMMDNKSDLPARDLSEGGDAP